MRSRRSALFLLLSLLLVAGLSAWWWPQLPDTLASHFNGAGVADGWMSKPMFFGVMGLAGVGSGLAVAGAALIVKLVDPSQISMPNRDYWLAPERREASLDRMQSLLLQYAAVTVVGVAACLHLVAGTNLMPEPVLPNGPFMAGLVAYFLYTGAWLWWLVRGFRLPRAA